jgi:hypothetical protein
VSYGELMTHPQDKPKDIYSRMVEMAFWAELPGATAHDRLEYLKDLLREYGLKIVDRESTVPPMVPDFDNRESAIKSHHSKLRVH